MLVELYLEQYQKIRFHEMCLHVYRLVHFVITQSQKLSMLFYKFINTQTLTLNLQNITKCSLNK